MPYFSIIIQYVSEFRKLANNCILSKLSQKLPALKNIILNTISTTYLVLIIAR